MYCLVGSVTIRDCELYQYDYIRADVVIEVLTIAIIVSCRCESVCGESERRPHRAASSEDA